MSIDRADGVDGAALSGLCAACLLRAASEMQEASDRRLDPGSTLGPYQIVSTLGCGGMGRVYLGWDPRLCRTVAIKVLAAPFTADIERTRLLQREARIVAGLNHPRICAVHDLGCEVAQRFDASQVRLVDEPRVVQEHVCGSATILPPCFSASTTGVLVYHVARLFRNQLAWFTRAGRQLDVAIEPGSYFGPMLSADGSRVMLDRHDPRTWQLGIWQYDLKRRVLSRLLDESRTAAYRSGCSTRRSWSC